MSESGLSLRKLGFKGQALHRRESVQPHNCMCSYICPVSLPPPVVRSWLSPNWPDKEAALSNASVENLNVARAIMDGSRGSKSTSCSSYLTNAASHHSSVNLYDTRFGGFPYSKTLRVQACSQKTTVHCRCIPFKKQCRSMSHRTWVGIFVGQPARNHTHKMADACELLTTSRIISSPGFIWFVFYWLT